MKKNLYTFLTVLFLSGAIFSCSKEETSVAPITPVTHADTAVSAGFPEGFETGSKGSYAIADVSLGSGIWSLNEALIGTTTSDRKSGLASARIRDLGKLTMKFDVTNGAGSITVKHAKYGTDANSTWELWASTNSGSTWTKVGSTITTSSTTLSTASFTANLSGTVRIEIRKTGGGTARINIDDITINDYGTSGGGTVDTGGSTTPTTDNTHLALGNPSAAVTNSSTHFNNYLLTKSQFVMSYSRDRGTPNWVAWHLNNSWLGSTPRQDDFRADATLPTGWYRVGGTSYSGSGFDRGHNCPSADRTLTVTDNSATFLMTNMIPQAPTNNQQTWANLENYGRTLVDAGNEIYIIMGSYGTGGSGTNGTYNTIDAGRVTVPNRVWKVMLVLPNGTNDVSRITTATRVIAIDTPNSNSVSSTWGTYRTSVDAIEAATGYNLFSNLSSTLQSSLESKIDTGPTN